MMRKVSIIILVILSISIYFQNDKNDGEVIEFLERIHKTLREIREILQNKRYPRKSNKSRAKKWAARKQIIKKLSNPFFLVQPRHKVIDYTKRQPTATIQNKSNNLTTNNQQLTPIQSSETSKFINSVLRNNLVVLPFPFPGLKQSMQKSANSKQDIEDKGQDKQYKDILDDYDYFNTVDQLRGWVNNILSGVLLFWAQVEKMITNPAMQPLCNDRSLIIDKTHFQNYQDAYLKSVKELYEYSVIDLFAPICFPGFNLLQLEHTIFGCAGYNKNNWLWGRDLCEFYKNRGSKFISGNGTNLIRRLIALNAYGSCISKIDSNLHRIIKCFKGGSPDFRRSCKEVLTTGVKKLYREAKFYLRNARDIFIDLLKYYMEHLRLESSKELREEEIPKFLLYTLFKKSLISGVYPSLYYIIAGDNALCAISGFETAISKLKGAYLAVARIINYQGSIDNASSFVAQLENISYDTFKELLGRYPAELSLLLNPKRVLLSYYDSIFNDCVRAIISAVNFKLEQKALAIGDMTITSHTIYLPDLVDISKFANILDTISNNGANIFCEGNYGLFDSLYQLTNNIFTNYSQYVDKINVGSNIKESFTYSSIAAFSKFVTATYPIIKQLQKEVEQLKQKKDELRKGNLSDCEKIILASLFNVSDSVTVDIMPMLRDMTEKFVSNLQELMEKLTNSFESEKIDELINLFSTVYKISSVRKYVSLYIYLTFGITLNNNCGNLRSLGSLPISSDLRKLLEMAYKDELIVSYLKKYEKQEYKGFYEVFMKSIGMYLDDRIIGGISSIGSSADSSNLKQLCVNFKMLDCIRGEYALQYYCLRPNTMKGICSEEILISDSRGVKVALDYLQDNFANCFNNFKCPYYEGTIKKRYIRKIEDICPYSQQQRRYVCPPGINEKDVEDICKYDDILQSGCLYLADAIIQNTYNVSKAQEDVIKKIGVSTYISKVKECCNRCVLSDETRAKLDEECNKNFVGLVSKVFTSTELSLKNAFIRNFVCSKKNCDASPGECKEEVKNGTLYIPTWGEEVPFEDGCQKNDADCFKKKCDTHIGTLDTIIRRSTFGCH